MPASSYLDCMRRDRAALTRLRRAGRQAQHDALRQASRARRAARAAGRPALEFIQALPIYHYRAAIQAAIRDHQVVVICGETGSGKSTQIPRLCLDLGRGIDGFIGLTQPRRVAARAIATRLAEELGGPVGGHAGYKYRFAEQLSEASYVKVLTDGTLLAELETDRQLTQYDTLIIDEAHERSLNIDFLLGVLKRLLPRRPDLRLIVTSATIDPQQFSRYFDDAPVIEVSGRGFPVEIRYRPFEQNDGEPADRKLDVSLLHAVDELRHEAPGDILVFLPGEFHIHRAAELLRRKRYADTEILPLYARLPAGDQARIFKPGGRRRIVLATNVAETSITVPGIRYVIDSGLARISRYQPARQLQALPIEAVSQASARQRAGRCGREADGIAIRLYSEVDFNAREAFTAPEVARSSLAGVILTMHRLRLGRIEEFPFPEPPPPRQIKAGYRLLEELGALDAGRELTATGTRLARIPVDPRIGRMLLAAGRQHCASEVLTIAAALSIQDPRNFPDAALAAARQAHARDRHPGSDFLSLLNLWQRYRRETRALSRRQRDRYCRQQFLSIARMREWRQLRDQLARIARQLDIALNDQPASDAAVHKALLSGLLGNIARRHDDHEYHGTQGKKLYIHRSSVLAKRRPRWLMGAELVHTGRLYARTNAILDPAWVEEPAAHLVRRDYLDPAWDTASGEVMVREQVSLYGLTLVRGRRVRYAPVDRAQARRLFIAQALVPGDLDPPPAFIADNQAMIHAARDVEQRARRRGIAIDDQSLFAFYDARLPDEVCDIRSLQNWLQRGGRDAHDTLVLSAAEARAGTPDEDWRERFPDHLVVSGNRLALHYHFEPGHPRDGVTLRVPAPLLRQLPAARLSWLVPGLVVEKMTALVRALPKAPRRGLGPANDAARYCRRHMTPRDDESLMQCMSRTFAELRGVEVPVDAWDEPALPAHLRFNIEVIDGAGELLAAGRDLAELVRQAPDPDPGDRDADAPLPAWVQGGLQGWPPADLPETLVHRRAGVQLESWVALRDDGDTVAVALYDRRTEAQAAMADGITRLLRLRLKRKLKYLDRNLPQAERMCLNFAALGGCQALRQDIIAAAMARGRTTAAWRIRSRPAFDAELDALDQALVPEAAAICARVAPALERFRDCMRQLDSLPAATRADIAEQLDLLIYPGFVTATPAARLDHLARYLRGVQQRIAHCLIEPQRDLARLERVRGYWQRLLENCPPPPEPITGELGRFRWMLEEFRVSVFAQSLGTAEPVSSKRLDAQWRKYRQSAA